MGSRNAQRVRRQPEGTVLYRAVQAAWQPFVGQVATGERLVPRFCRREVEAFLRCGILAHGFARMHCGDCGQDDVVAFSCKGRGFCPSCGGRRMVETAARLCDAVIYVWLCPHCGGRRRLLTAIQDPAAIGKVLATMGLSAAVPELAAARSPPGEVGMEFSG